MKDIVNLRPHHLLCITNFDEIGYSTEFIGKVKEVRRAIDDNSIYIKIVEGQDDLCLHCPTRMECSSMSFPRILDKKMLIATGISYGEIYEASSLMERIRSSISWNIMNMICENCAFYYKCKQIYLKKKAV